MQTLKQFVKIVLLINENTNQTAMKKNLTIIFCLFIFALEANAQTVKPKAEPTPPRDAKKTNRRAGAPKPEPFEKADVKTMEAQCVRLETESGNIELELFPETSPETVRNFLNLTALGIFDGTAFSRVVPGFVVQGGNVSTRENLTVEIVNRARRIIPDEPNQVKHERGIVSMARGEEPNTATSHFFILLTTASYLDGKFAAFGRVIIGIDVVEAINKMPVENEKPVKPIRLTRATVFPCPIKSENVN